MGRNDKGLVTYDRRIKKDAFCFYKANWNTKDKFIYVAGRREVNKSRKSVNIQAFSNSGAADLWLNGKNMGKAQPNQVNVLEWENVLLREGENHIEVVNECARDKCVWVLSTQG